MIGVEEPHMRYLELSGFKVVGGRIWIINCLCYIIWEDESCLSDRIILGNACEKTKSVGNVCEKTKSVVDAFEKKISVGNACEKTISLR